jgi:uncharacterized protein (PEP-CTERM system associated)
LRPFLLLAACTAGWTGWTDRAQAFPLTDALTPSILAPLPTPAPATGAAPEAPTEPRDLTAQIGPPGPFAGAPTPGWTFTPRVGAQTSYNSNVLATHSNPRWDWVNYFTPGLTVRADTERVTAQFDYAPTLGIYARTPELNFLGQNFTGNGSITFVPDLFYMDVRGVAGVQPRNGAGFGNAGAGATGATTGLPPNQLNQAASVSVTPYLLHRFNEYGTGKIGYSFNATNSRPVTGFGSFPFINSGSSSSSSNLSQATINQLNQSGFVNQSGLTNQSSTLVTNQEVAQFQTGEFLGRFNNLTVAAASQYSGSFGTQNGYQNTITNQLGYALTRQVTVFGAIGYENIHYGGVPPTQINDATWQVGTTLTPNADSKITIGYGHQYGVDSLLVDGSYQVTPRFRVSVSYNTGIGNGLTQLQNNVAVSDVNQYGYLVNALTGAPLFNAAGIAGSNNNLYRTKTLAGTASLALDRDVIIASIFVSDQQFLAAPQGVSGIATNTTNSTSTTGQASWTHELGPALSSIVSGSYTTQPSQSTVVPGTQTTINANLILQYQFNPTLTGSAQYSYYDRNSPFTVLSFTQNVFLLGIMKTF